MSGYFGKKPGFRIQPLTLSQIWTQLAGAARTISATWSFIKTAQASAAETIADFGVTDNSGRLSILNGSATDSAFLPQIKGTNSTSTEALTLTGAATTDSGTAPVMRLDFRTAADAAIANRPGIAFSNNSTRLGTWWPTGLMIGSGTSTAANAKLEVQDSSSQIAFGTGADQGFILGVSGAAYYGYGIKWTGAAFQARQTAGSLISPRGNSIQFQLFTGATIGNAVTPTVGATLDGTGLGVGGVPGCKGDFAGTIRTSASNTPSSGDGMEFRYDTAGFYGLIIGYNRSTSTYREVRLDGLRIALYASGSAALTAGSTTVDCGVPLKHKTCTTGTRPGAVTVGTGTEAFDTTIGKPIWSNGTIWVLADGTAA